MDLSITITLDWRVSGTENQFRVCYVIPEDQEKYLNDKKIDFIIRNKDYHKFLNRNNKPSWCDITVESNTLGNSIRNRWKKANKQLFGCDFNPLISRDTREEFLVWYRKELKTRIDEDSTGISTVKVTVDLINIESTNVVDNSALDKINVNIPPFMIIDGVTYKVNLEALKNKKSLVNLADNLSEKLHGLYNNQASTIKQTLTEEITELQNEINKTKEDSFIEGLRLCTSLMSEGWVIKDGMLFNPIHVRANRVLYRRKQYIIPDNDPEVPEFFIEGISIPISNKVDGVTCLKAYHDNAKEHQSAPGIFSLCLGDLKNKPLRYVLDKIVEVFSTVNLEGGWHSYVETKLVSLINDEKLILIDDKSIWTTRQN